MVKKHTQDMFLDITKLKGIKRSMHLNFTQADNATRSGFGDALLELGNKYNKQENAKTTIYAVCADLTGSVKMDKFKASFPNHFVQVGVAEQNLVTVASGIAATSTTRHKVIPFASSYAAFMPGRCWEQIRTTICYNDQPVKLVGAHAGVATGPDGATHQMLEDLALMRSLPNMVVVVPSDYNQAKQATKAIAKHKGPAYLRVTRPKSITITTSKTPFTIGKANILKEGNDVTLLACGMQVWEALKAAALLQLNYGISAQVIDCHTIKPFDKRTILKSVNKTRNVITIEDHQVTGGLASAVAETLAINQHTLYKSNNYSPITFKRMGMQDQFGESGEPYELLDHFKLTAKHIVNEAKKIVKRY